MIDHFSPNDSICNKCKLPFYKKNKCAGKDKQKQPDHVQTQSPTLTINVQTSGKCHSKGVVCNKQERFMSVVSEKARIDFFKRTGVLLQKKARTCQTHLTNGLLKMAVTDATALKAKVSTSMRMSGREVSEILRNLTQSNEKSKLVFDHPGNLSSDDYLNLTGLTESQFDDMVGHAETEDIRNTRVRSLRTCIAILMVKLRTGLGNTVLGSLFSMNRFQVYIF